ncbi:MAG: lysophospholipid acyltransferase family protein [Planctomycetota bacterium]|nr:MAG: lysophospholipid acyltransferase family protein [Planctomycetota bacterium]
MARLLYRLLVPVRTLSETQCRAALGNHIVDLDIPIIAEQSFIHRVWNLTDLLLADRFLQSQTYHRYGGRIPQDQLDRMLKAQNRGQPAILLTAYYGSFDLIPIFLGYNGIRAGVVYKPHANVQFDIYRRKIRERSGCELIPLNQAGNRLGRILEAGGAVAIVADHHADQRGIPVTFLGLPTMAMRSVGLLAWRYHADVVVAGIRRINNMFRFQFIVTDIVDHSEWEKQDDAVTYITERYLRALEKIILDDPTQYLWGHPRWGEDFARRLIVDE